MVQVFTRWKYYLFFIITLLPLSAFAAEGGSSPSGISSFFTPPPGDLSVYMLGRVFGVMGNTLHGSGNQLIGILMGIFNAAWVVAIGIAVLWTVWSSVISAAGSGEMMGGHGKGKKAAFTIIRIVIGFSLVVPSATTGYSMAQTAVMWVAIQGIGLAGQISDRFHDYVGQGGTVVAVEPVTVDELSDILPMNITILQSEICMYKLQSIIEKENQAKKEAQSGLGEVTDVLGPVTTAGKDLSVGYAFNDDHTITFGTRNTQFNAGDKSSHMFNNECGSVTLDQAAARMANTPVEELKGDILYSKEYEAIQKKIGGYQPPAFVPPPSKTVYVSSKNAKTGKVNTVATSVPPTDAEIAAAKEAYNARIKSDELAHMARAQQVAQELVLYQQAAVTEAILAMQPVASAIASADIAHLDIHNDEDRAKVFNELQQKGGYAMATSAISYSTLFDPIRRKVSEGGQNEGDKRMAELKAKGWLYTPIAILSSGYMPPTLKISDYLPMVSGPKLGEIKDIPENDQVSLEKSVNLPTADQYTPWAEAYLDRINQYASINKSKIEFGGGVSSASGTNFLDPMNLDVGSGLNSACSWIADGISDLANTAGEAIVDTATQGYEGAKDVGEAGYEGAKDAAKDVGSAVGGAAKGARNCWGLC